MVQEPVQMYLFHTKTCCALFTLGQCCLGHSTYCYPSEYLVAESMQYKIVCSSRGTKETEETLLPGQIGQALLQKKYSNVTRKSRVT